VTGAAAQGPSFGDAVEAAMGQRPSRVSRLSGGDIGETYGDAIEAAMGQRPSRVSKLSGGDVGETYKVELKDRTQLVAKVSETGGLAVEGFMLGYLKMHSELPVPEVLHAADKLLLLEFVETTGGLTAAAEAHAAELLAALHGINAENFGFEGNTVIGGLPQPNPWTPRWRDFFRDQRLLYMGRLALDRGKLIRATFARLEKLCGRLEDYIEEPARPALIHGDCWGGNVLTRDGRIAAFVDPAIYYADPEIELAFATLFATFGTAFFARYQELRPIAPGFFEARRDIYNLYPLLVHSALFGGQYPDQVHRVLARYA
jgi:fructosamine-3-kinase